MDKLCECGTCGQYVKPGRRFISGHNCIGKVSHRLGKSFPHTDNWNKNIGKSLLGKNIWTKGVKQTEDWILKRTKNIGKVIENLWKNPNSKFNSKKYRENLSNMFSGENNPTFNNWSSFGGYGPGFNKKLKNYIREKFNYTCVLCGEWANIPHHIDYDKMNNIEANFVLLCRGDNSRVNVNRVFWETQFKILNGIFDPKFLGL